MFDLVQPVFTNHSQPCSGANIPPLVSLHSTIFIEPTKEGYMTDEEVAVRIIEQGAEINRKAMAHLNDGDYRAYRAEKKRFEAWECANWHLLAHNETFKTSQAAPISTITDEQWAEIDQNPTETAVMSAIKNGIE